MLGDGTKLGVATDNPPPARLLDLTRLVSRAGRVATGVDRVALADRSRLIKEAVPVYGLVRTAPGYLLLDREGMRALLARCRGEIPWGPVDGMSHLAFRLTPAQKRGQSDARRLSFARAPRQRLSALLARNLPSGIAYVNVGHTNLSERAIRALHGINARITVMIHDTIPLDFPQYQYAGSVTRFRE